jgi:hypothetical protein
MGIAVGDADGDGAMDMFVTHWIAEANAFYLNKRLKRPGELALDFEDAAERFGLGQISTDDIGWGTAFLDVDADSWPDLVAVNGSTFEDPADTRKLIAMPMRLFWNRDGKRFTDVAPLSGSELVRPRVGRGLATADVDGDLREEIAVVVHGGKLALLKAEGIARPSERSSFSKRAGRRSAGKSMPALRTCHKTLPRRSSDSARRIASGA